MLDDDYKSEDDMEDGQVRKNFKDVDPKNPFNISEEDKYYIS